MPRRVRFTHGENIATDLHPLCVPIEWIKLLPGNPRRGKIEAIAKSYQRFSQRKPIVVNRTGEVDGHPVGYSEAGNHQLQAVQKMGWEYIAVVWVDDDDVTAKAFSLADNQLHSIGEYDSPLLAEFVAEIATDPLGVDLLIDAGFDGDDLTRMIQSVMAEPNPPAPTTQPAVNDPSELTGPRTDEPPTAVLATTIVFDDALQQAAWFRLMQFLRERFPDSDSTGERVQRHVVELIGDDQ